MKKKLIIIVSVVVAVAVATGIVLACVLSSKDDPVAVESIMLSKTRLTMEIDDEEALTVTFEPTTATDKTVTWSSSAPTVVSVDNSGKVKALAAGTATVTATTANGKTATCAVTVNEPTVAVESISLNKTELTFEIDDEETLTVSYVPATATDKTVTWISAAPTIASVDSMGKVKALAAGTATITVTTANGKTATCEVTVNAPPVAVESITLSKTELTLEIDDEETLTVSYEPATATDKTVTWISAAPTIASVDSTGKVKALAAGAATITAKTANGKTATCVVTVKTPIVAVESITLDKTELSLEIGGEETLTVSYEPTTATDKTVAWSCSASKVASVDSTGKVVALSEGTATITATTANNKTATCEVTVTIPGPSDGLKFVRVVDSNNNLLYYSVERGTATGNTIVIPAEYNGTAVQAIGNNAFVRCDWITNIILPDTITKIGDSAFAGCKKLNNITLPESVKTIGKYAFNQCEAFTSITIHENVTSIGEGAFKSCTNLETVNWNATSCSAVYNETNKVAIFQSCTKLVNLNLKDGITYIPQYAFANCTALSTISIPESVVDISANSFNNTAFYNDSANWEGDALYLGNILLSTKYAISDTYTVKDGTRLIASRAFYNRPNVQRIIIADSVTKVCANAITACSSLKYILFGSGIQEIGGGYISCNQMWGIFYKGTAEDWAKVQGRSNVTLKTTTIYFYSKDEPALTADGTAYDGNFWHYNDKGLPTEWYKFNG